MTETPQEETTQPAPAPAPKPEPAPEETKKQEGGKKPSTRKNDFPVGQAAVGGVGAVTLGSAALVSVVGPWGWLAAPAAATAAGGAYVAYRKRKKGQQEKRTERVTTTKSSGSRLSGGGLLGGGRGRASAPAGGKSSGAATSAKRSGGLGSSPKGGGSGAGAKPGGSPKPGGSSAPKGSPPKGGGSSPRGGAAPRGGSSKPGASPRGTGRGGGGLFGRGTSGRGSGGGSSKGGGLFGSRKSPGSRGGGGGTLTGRRHGAPPTSDPKTTTSTKKKGAGGGMTDSTTPSRWARTRAAIGDRTRRAGAATRRGARRTGDWADRKTGRRASTGWKAARDKNGFNNRRKAAGAAVKKAGGGGLVAGIVGVGVAIVAAIAGLFGWLFSSKKKDTPTEDTDPKTEEAATEPGTVYEGSPFSWTDRPTTEDPRAGRYRPTRPPGEYPATKEHPIGFGWGPVAPKPDVPPPSSTHTGGTRMSGLPASQIAHDMAGAMARYEPADAYEIVPDSKQWADVPTQVAMSVKAYADRLEGARFPINSAINDKLRDFAQAIASTRSIAEELEPLMRKAHAEDLARRETPRGDESKWDIK